MKLKFKFKITRSTLGYAAFTVAALIVFAYLRFPGETFARYLAALATDLNPEAILLVDDIKPAIPPGMTLDNVTLGFRDTPQATISADAVTVGPAWLPLFKGRSAAAFAAKTYGGTVNGQAQTGRFLALDGPIDWNVYLDGIDVGKIAYLKERLGHQITGNLTGVMTFSGPLESMQNGAGNFDFTLVNGAYPLRETIMGMERLDFRKVEAAVGIKNGVLTIKRLRLTGDRINGTLSGDIVLNGADIKSSQISLNFTFELAGQNKKISMIMTGALSNPQIRLT
jgi:type II secretion system protein N